MKFHGGWVAGALMVLVAATLAGAQMGMQAPPQFRGIWSPTVGSGAVYSVEGQSGKSEIEVAIVGAEGHMGKPGHWVEMILKGPQGAMVMKTLMVAQMEDLRPARMIMQQAGQEAMEMPMEMMGMGGRRSEAKADFRKEATRVGTETVTVGAGTFTCEHWKMNDGSGEMWIADKTGPWGLVKTVSKDGSMTLLKVLTDAKTKITGPVKKFDPQEMMRRPNER